MLTKPNELHDAFNELRSWNLVLDKQMASELVKIDKCFVEVKKLQAQLNKSTTSLQYALDTNNILYNKNKEMETELSLLRVDLDNWQQ